MSTSVIFLAFVTLSIIEKNSTYNDIDCPGDTILYNCSIESNSENIHLTWTIKFPGFVPIEITYNSTSIPGDVDYLDMNISVKLIDFMYQDIIQSTLLLTQLNKIPMNGTEVQCSIAPVLANDTVTVFINTSGMFKWPSLMSVMELFLLMQYPMLPQVSISQMHMRMNSTSQ